MNNLIPYLLEASVLLIIFYLFFFLMIRNELSFGLNRFCLLSFTMIALVFPLLKIPVTNTLNIVDGGSIPFLTLPAFVIKGSSEQSISILFLGYLSGLTISVFLLFFKLFQLLRFLMNAKKVDKGDHQLIEVGGNYSTFSFLNFLFWKEQTGQSEEEKRQILIHELEHIKGRHSLDILFYEVLHVVFWFNPIIFLYKNSIKEIHEFIADRAVLIQKPSDCYLGLLAKEALRSSNLYLSSHFNQNLINRRITMINQTKTNRGSRMKYLVSIPLVIVMFLLFSFKDLEKSAPQTLFTANQNDPGPYKTVDQLPEFEGGIEGLSKFLGSNLKYPSEAVKKKVEGTTFITFVVNEDGTTADTKIAKGFNAECDAEALRVVKNTSGKWVPGKNDGKTVKVLYTLPIKFKM